MKSISIIIPTYNGNELLDKYLPSVVRACENYNGEWKIIVVDDGGEKIPLLPFSKGENIKYIRRQQNGGFSKAMNTGIKQAKGEIVIALNNDVMVTSSFIEPLIKYFDDPLVFSVKPQSVLPDRKNESIKAIKINKGMIESINSPVEKWGKDVLELPYSCAGSAAYDKNKLLELGGFDEIYSPFYWEDFDLGYRAIKRGWKNIYVPESVVFHEHSATISKMNSTFGKDGRGVVNKQVIFIRNREIFYWKNICDFKLNTIALLSFLIRFIKAIILREKDIYKGLMDFLKILPAVMKKRRKEKRASEVKDKEIIKRFSL